jgi:hypothetical protein
MMSEIQNTPLKAEVKSKQNKQTSSDNKIAFLSEEDCLEHNHKDAIQWAGYQSRQDPDRWIFLAVCPRTNRLALIQRDMFSAHAWQYIECSRPYSSDPYCCIDFECSLNKTSKDFAQKVLSKAELKWLKTHKRSIVKQIEAKFKDWDKRVLAGESHE